MLGIPKTNLQSVDVLVDLGMTSGDLKWPDLTKNQKCVRKTEDLYNELGDLGLTIYYNFFERAKVLKNTRKRNKLEMDLFGGVKIDLLSKLFFKTPSGQKLIFFKGSFYEKRIIRRII